MFFGFFYVGPNGLLPVADGLFVAIRCPALGPPAAPSERYQKLPHVVWMTAHSKFVLDQARDLLGRSPSWVRTWTGPSELP
jgi:hypothetical protein